LPPAGPIPGMSCHGPSRHGAALLWRRSERDEQVCQAKQKPVRRNPHARDLNNASSTGELHAFELRTTPENSAYYASKYLIFQRLTPYVSMAHHNVTLILFSVASDIRSTSSPSSTIVARPQVTSFVVCRLYAGRKCLGHVVDVFETKGRKKVWWRLRTADGLAIFETRDDAIRARGKG
jgi:hypothetical protein